MKHSNISKMTLNCRCILMCVHPTRSIASSTSSWMTALINGKFVPLRVMDNASFIINLDHVLFEADDLGSWKPTGTKHTYFRFTDAGEIVYKQGVSHAAGYYDLTRRSWNVSYRLIVSIEGMSQYIMYIILNNWLL